MEGSKKPGRPRSTAVRDAVLAAALDQTRRVGFSAVTIESIAAAALTSKTTVYRWWPHKAAIVMDAFMAAAATVIEPAPTGELRADLVRQMTALADFLNSAAAGQVLTSLIAEAQTSRELADAILERWLRPRRAAAAAHFARARANGQLVATVDDDVLIDVLYGGLYFRLMLRHARVDAAFVTAAVTAVLDGVGPRA